MLTLLACAYADAFAEELSITPATMARIGTVDAALPILQRRDGRSDRWHDSGSPTAPSAFAGSDRFAYRAPIDLANTRLRKFAAALAPAYLRVSGTWANATYFADSDTATGAAGRIQWRPDPSAVARRDRLLPRGRRADRHLLRRQPGHPRRGRRMDTRSGITPARLYRVDRRPYRCGEFMNEPNVAMTACCRIATMRRRMAATSGHFVRS